MIIKRKNYMFALKFTSAQHSWYAHMEFPHILHYSGMWDVLIAFIFFFFFSFSAGLLSLRDLNFPTRDWIWAPGSEGLES